MSCLCDVSNVARSQSHYINDYNYMFWIVVSVGGLSKFPP